MKATGIIRRIDDLGRVVIPKEIRRSMKIREGDPLEIYTDTNGTVCFRKYSPIGEMDIQVIKAVCDGGLGNLNYTLFDRDGESVLPKDMLNIDVDNLPQNTVCVKANGDLIGYLQSPNTNRQIVADIVGRLFED